MQQKLINESYLRINSRRETFAKMIVQFCFVFSLSRLLLNKLKIEAPFKTDRKYLKYIYRPGTEW